MTAKARTRRTKRPSKAKAARKAAAPAVAAVLMGKAIAIEYASAVDGVKYRHQFKASARASLYRTREGTTLIVQPVRTRNEYIED